MTAYYIRCAFGRALVSFPAFLEKKVNMSENFALSLLLLTVC